MGTSNADSKVIWMDGKLIPYDDASVHVLSHSLHYGGAAFEGMRAYETKNGKTAIFRAEEHFLRFFDSIRVLTYSTPYSVSDFIAATIECIRANDMKECYIRPLAYIDDSSRGLKLPEHPKARMAIAVWNWGKYMGAEGQKNGIRVGVSSYRRPDVSTALPWAKLSANYLTSVLARREATHHNLDEALLLDTQGYVAEGSGENIFVVKKGVLYTPPGGSILPGITRNSIIELATELGYTVKEEAITRNQLYIADEVFFTGTAVEVTPIREIDHFTIADGKPGPITRKLSDLFFKCVRAESPEHMKWLTFA